MPSATGRLETPNGSKYLQQLCKHFSHKIAVTYDETSGHCAMPLGPAEMRADPEGLTVTVTAADSSGLERAKGVIDSHLARFAFRENFEKMPWVNG